MSIRCRSRSQGTSRGTGMFNAGPAWQRYGQTKLANAMLSELFREKLAKKSSKIKIARRGPGAGGHGAASHDEPFVPHHESVGD